MRNPHNILRLFVLAALPGLAVVAPCLTSAAPAHHPAAAQLIFQNNFDSQRAGAVAVGPAMNQFTGVRGASRVTVENQVTFSQPNALSVRVDGGGSAYVYKQYAGSVPGHTLQFHLMIGRDFYSDKSYLVLVRTRPGPPTNVRNGQVLLVLGSKVNLFLVYWDTAGVKHYIWSKVQFHTGTWYALGLHERVGAVDGALSLTVSGQQVAGATNLRLGSKEITYFALGDRWTPFSTHTTGHLYFDDIVTTTP